MNYPKHPIRKCVISTAIVASLALTPIATSSVSADSHSTLFQSSLISSGDRGAPVSSLQSELADEGYYNYNIDGIFGPLTRSAVISFQSTEGLIVDGIAGPQTKRALTSGGSSASTSTDTSSSNSSILRSGDRGPAVSSLQSELAEFGYYSYGVDGIYGPLTRKAVISFQSAHGLMVDGIAGPQTRTALGSADVSSSSGSSSSASSSGIVSAAKNLLGIPYEFGGTTRAALDSSGFINETFEQVGIDLHRTHAQMWVNNGTHVSSPSPGDVVFFENTYKQGVSHSGVYIGGNTMIHAGSDGVERSNLSYDYWSDRYIGAKSFH